MDATSTIRPSAHSAHFIDSENYTNGTVITTRTEWHFGLILINKLFDSQHF
jgi:hypothetical protein